jgi:signal peptidase I
MRRGIPSLAVISATASFFGLLGTVLVMLGSFRSFGTSQSTALGDIAGRLSQSLLPTLLGLFVGISAFCFYRHLSGQIETFELEMENASIQLISSLVIHLRRNGNAGGIYWSSFTKKRRGVSREILFLPNHSIEGPRLTIERIHRNGVFELVWPRLQSQLDADCILQGGKWVSFAYGLAGWLAYFSERRPIAGLITAAFFVLAGLGIRTGSLGAIFGIFVFLSFTFATCVFTFGLTLSPICVAAAPILLVGSVKAARFVSSYEASPIVVTGTGWQASVKSLRKVLRPLQGILLGLLGILASVVVLFGTVLAIYSMGADNSVEPGLRPGGFIVSLTAPSMGAVHRGALVIFTYGTTVRTERVAGLPSDRIQVKAGRLIRNGKAIPEPYCTRPYRGGPGDFPLPSEAYTDEFTRWEHQYVYGDTLEQGKPFIVPTGSYFVLNDDRNELTDSRISGPVPAENIMGRPLLAYNARNGVWVLPRLVH